MSCFTPLHAWFSSDLNASGKRSVVFDPKLASLARPLELACGQCIGCREDRAKSWAVRCMHEISLHKENCFITLTFNEDSLSSSGSLDKRDFQLFMKRLRKKFPGKRIRYFHCGEYGEQYGRPHHHAILFGLDFNDKKPFKTNLFTSEVLSDLWTSGFSTVGAANFESAAYVARYCVKKLTGDAASAYGDLLPEYTSMSRRPGIARDWYLSFGVTDCHRNDFVLVRGFKNFKVKPPKYYDRLFELTDAQGFDKLRRCRVLRAKFSPDNSIERLEDRHVVALARSRSRKRSYESYV